MATKKSNRDANLPSSYQFQPIASENSRFVVKDSNKKSIPWLFDSTYMRVLAQLILSRNEVI